MTPPPDRIEEIERLVERGARDSRTHTFAQLADLYRETGQLARALEVIEAGLKHHPHYVNARLVHARLLRELERPEEASRAFARVLEIDSENQVAKEAIAGLAEGAAEPAGPADDDPGRRAAGWLARLDADWRHETQDRHEPSGGRALRGPSGDGLETATLAALYVRQGLTEQAIGIYERLLARDPYNARLAAALESARQRGQARPDPDSPPTPAPDVVPAPEVSPDPRSGDEPIREFLEALLEGRAPADDADGGREDWREWLTALGPGAS